MLEDVPEKACFAMSLVPPLLLTGVILMLLKLDPRPLMNSIAFLIPGNLRHTYDKGDGMLRLRLDVSADFWSAQLDKFKEKFAAKTSSSRPRLPSAGPPQEPSLSRGSTGSTGGGDLVRSITTLEGSVPEGIARADTERTRHSLRSSDPSLGPRGGNGQSVVDLYINTKHLSRTSLIPVLFLVCYFWDSAIFKKAASTDFPLDSCMEPDLNRCFWIDREYSTFAYPDYQKLDCQAMWNTTIHGEVVTTFAFKAPVEAKFYKCYELRFAAEDVLAGLGDVAALFMLTGVFILRYSIAFTSLTLGEAGRREALEELASQKRRVHCWIVVWLVVLSLTVLVWQTSYGVYTEGYVVLFMVPGFCLFCIILLWNRREVLQEQMRTVQEESESTEESETKSESTDRSGNSTDSSLNQRRWAEHRQQGAGRSMTSEMLMPV